MMSNLSEHLGLGYTYSNLCKQHYHYLKLYLLQLHHSEIIIVITFFLCQQFDIMLADFNEELANQMAMCNNGKIQLGLACSVLNRI